LIGVGLEVGVASVFVVGFRVEDATGVGFFVSIDVRGVVDATGTGFFVPIGVRTGLFAAAGVLVVEAGFLTGVVPLVVVGAVFFAIGTGFLVPIGVLAGLVGVADVGFGAIGFLIGVLVSFEAVGDIFACLATLSTPASPTISLNTTSDLTTKVPTLERGILLLQVIHRRHLDSKY
jgi:hypothetical protein